MRRTQLRPSRPLYRGPGLLHHDGGRRQPMRSRSYPTLLLHWLVVLASGVLPATIYLAWAKQLQTAIVKPPFTSKCRTKAARVSAILKATTQPSQADSVTLVFHRAYQPGDRIFFSGTQEMAVRMDQTMPECLIYAPNYSSGNLVYELPYGRAEQETGSAYAPESLSGDSHRVTRSRPDRTGASRLSQPCSESLRSTTGRSRNLPPRNFQQRCKEPVRLCGEKCDRRGEPEWPSWCVALPVLGARIDS